MSNSFYTIRNYQPADFENYFQLIIEAEKLEPVGRCTSPVVLSGNLYRPNYFPERDLFIVEIAGSIVGYLDVAPELNICRAIYNCYVHPEHRRRGLATKLYSYATDRARELGVSVAHVDIAQGNVVAQKVLSKLGFRFARCFFQLRLAMAEISGRDINQGDLLYRPLQHGEEDKLTEIQNRSFAGTWGFNPNSVEEISYHTNLSRCSPEDIVLACDGDKIIGYCWTRIAEETSKQERKGQIFMLGVDPDYRGRGIGKRVLLAGLAGLKSKGFQVAELTVDRENRAALTLYRSIGFRVWARTLWYEKAIC